MRPKRITTVCQHCAEEIKVKPSHLAKGEGKYCSCECRDKAKTKRVKLICAYCGKEFYVKESKANVRKHCSQKCYDLARKEKSWELASEIVQVKCDCCGAILEKSKVRLTQNNFCSYECMGNWMRGNLVAEKARGWKGGKSQERPKVQNTIQYKNWRMQVFERDGFSCIICGQVGGELNAHHIKPWKDNIDLRFDINNGITLCEDCHKKIHSDKGLMLFVEAYGEQILN